MAAPGIGSAPGSQRGASLIEAMMALSIAAILASAAVPSMKEALVRQRLRGGSSDLHASFYLARSEAIRRSSPVAVTPLDGQDWSTGWRIFGDRDDDGRQDPGEETIVERPQTVASLTIRPFFGALFQGTVLSYNAEGRLHRPGSRGLVLGRLVLTLDGTSRSLCFASLSLRTVEAATCD